MVACMRLWNKTSKSQLNVAPVLKNLYFYLRREYERSRSHQSYYLSCCCVIFLTEENFEIKYVHRPIFWLMLFLVISMIWLYTHMFAVSYTHLTLPTTPYV